MDSTPNECGIFHRSTFQNKIIPQTRNIAPRFMNFQLSIDFVLVSVHHDCLADIYTTTDDPLLSHWVLSRGINCKVLPLRSVIQASIVEHYNDGILMGRALAESEPEFQNSNYGMIPAKESLFKEMLKTVRIEAGDEEDCMICLEELEVGFDASRMPCSHTFHGDCIEKWLRQSHYCPICRFEMPAN
ncbi:hypothetical protein ES332_A13G084100v1 [Gossypium tomentosum]|uniref:RING-type E3 ubiquitin transferase n=1 Tax=Gossypium tomentosum TaxID=34277 RepID=A0A5D2MIC4_GOSTO|nr:hypothetical protein ES332_A13G084100v1 [Gossypium tomentosum]